MRDDPGKLLTVLLGGEPGDRDVARKYKGVVGVIEVACIGVLCQTQEWAPLGEFVPGAADVDRRIVPRRGALFGEYEVEAEVRFIERVHHGADDCVLLAGQLAAGSKTRNIDPGDGNRPVVVDIKCAAGIEEDNLPGCGKLNLPGCAGAASQNCLNEAHWRGLEAPGQNARANRSASPATSAARRLPGLLNVLNEAYWWGLDAARANRSARTGISAARRLPGLLNVLNEAHWRGLDAARASRSARTGISAARRLPGLLINVLNEVRG